VIDNIIVDAKFKTFGCGSAIASSSVATEWLKGKSIDDALTIDNMDLVEELSLPPVKIHCSVLAEDAIKSAINDYRKKQGLQEIKFEDIFNDEKRESVKHFILENKQKNKL
jgi:nitrogen fixation NifU-like protein